MSIFSIENWQDEYIETEEYRIENVFICKDVLIEIFSYLTIRKLSQIRLVCLRFMIYIYRGLSRRVTNESLYNLPQKIYALLYNNNQYLIYRRIFYDFVPKGNYIRKSIRNNYIDGKLTLYTISNSGDGIITNIFLNKSGMIVIEIFPVHRTKRRFIYIYNRKPFNHPMFNKKYTVLRVIKGYNITHNERLEIINPSTFISNAHLQYRENHYSVSIKTNSKNKVKQFLRTLYVINLTNEHLRRIFGLLNRRFRN